MNWYELFYLMTMADRLQTFFQVFAIIATVIGVIAMIALVGSWVDKETVDEERIPFQKQARQWFFLSWPVMIIFWFLWVATPSKQDALLIVAGGAVGHFITSDSSAQKLPSDITKFLRIKILEQSQTLDLKDLLPIKEEMDTLKNKSKEELLEIIKKQAR